MKTIKTILFSSLVALGLGACHEDKAQIQHPASNSYSTAPDQTAPTPVESNTSMPANPDVNTTNPDMNGTTPAPVPVQPASPSAGAINSTDNASGSNAANQQRNGQRTNGTYNNSKNSVPASTNGTNVNTDGDMDRTGNSSTTKQGNPGTADQPDR